MNITMGLAPDSYKYVFGVYHKFGAPFDPDRKLSLTCGRRDRAAAQLLIYADEELLVCVGEDAAFDERGPIDVLRVSAKVPGLAEGSVRASLVGLVEDDDRQLKSDILLRQTSLRVDRRRVQPVWIEAEIGEGAAPGVYRAEITVYRRRMFEDERVEATLTFEIVVHEVTLGAPADQTFYLDLWQHNANIARKYDAELWSDGHFEVLEHYVASLAALGQKAVSLVVSEIPWSGQASCYDRIDPANLFEYSIVGAAKRADGTWAYDYRALDRYVELCERHGIKDEIEVFGLLNIWVYEDAGYGGIIADHPDAVRIRYRDEASGTYRFIRERSEFEAYVVALEKHFTDRGWIDRVRVLADEPSDLPLFRKRLGAMRKMAPSFQYKAAIAHASFMEEEGIVDHVPILDCAGQEHEQIMAMREGKTGRTLYYVACDVKHPNTFITSHLIEARAIPWIVWQLRLDGFLRWNYTVWPTDPLRKISYHHPFFPAGDTNFVYPGRDGRPLLSLRYKLLQKGIRDYEIIARYVREGGDRERLDSRMRSVIRWESPADLHRDARRRIEELISLDEADYDGLIAELLGELADGPEAR
ncbi:DUF4091 domain-containing protein [Cohnella ginsengisoli]|uniref:DUF4091 domain-containing protein n=1 Tax=Cohnella ginsengisoli TaxID=425004 RepID=A0A9X4KH16_9BACL|nr:DUF4091 domain-containing protein [Cohnella ginsengisoli]MDG0792134.1 DUF4091 domain-containing protein [Cohnella ginsengisoli]